MCVFIFVCILVCIKMLRLKRLKIELNSTYSVTEKADIRLTVCIYVCVLFKPTLGYAPTNRENPNFQLLSFAVALFILPQN